MTTTLSISFSFLSSFSLLAFSLSPPLFLFAFFSSPSSPFSPFAFSPFLPPLITLQFPTLPQEVHARAFVENHVIYVSAGDVDNIATVGKRHIHFLFTTSSSTPPSATTTTTTAATAAAAAAFSSFAFSPSLFLHLTLLCSLLFGSFFAPSLYPTSLPFLLSSAFSLSSASFSLSSTLSSSSFRSRRSLLSPVQDLASGWFSS